MVSKPISAFFDQSQLPDWRFSLLLTFFLRKRVRALRRPNSRHSVLPSFVLSFPPHSRLLFEPCLTHTLRSCPTVFSGAAEQSFYDPESFDNDELNSPLANRGHDHSSQSRPAIWCEDCESSGESSCIALIHLRPEKADRSSSFALHRSLNRGLRLCSRGLLIRLGTLPSLFPITTYNGEPISSPKTSSRPSLISFFLSFRQTTSRPPFVLSSSSFLHYLSTFSFPSLDLDLSLPCSPAAMLYWICMLSPSLSLFVEPVVYLFSAPLSQRYHYPMRSVRL